MTAAILCPGPSCLRFTREVRARYPLTIGVNRAPIILQGIELDWWCCADNRVITAYPCPYPIRTFTLEESRRRLAKKSPGLKVDMVYEDCFGPFPHDGTWARYSATGALILAATLGAKQIDVWGVDWQGIADADGHQYDFKNEEASKTRADWTAQRQMWNKTADLLAGRGVNVRRMNDGTH